MTSVWNNTKINILFYVFIFDRIITIRMFYQCECCNSKLKISDFTFEDDRRIRKVPRDYQASKSSSLKHLDLRYHLSTFLETGVYLKIASMTVHDRRTLEARFSNHDDTCDLFLSICISRVLYFITTYSRDEYLGLQ